MDWPTRSRVSDRKKPWYAAVFTVPPEGLNARSPHRYSPIYRPEGEMVRNLYLFDTLGTVSADPSPVSMGDTFCQFVGAPSIFSTGTPLEDARLDGHPNGKSLSRASPSVGSNSLSVRRAPPVVKFMLRNISNELLQNQ